jgi:hypothetical protein
MGKTKIEVQNAPAFKSERLYNKDLAPARERTWTGHIALLRRGVRLSEETLGDFETT